MTPFDNVTVTITKDDIDYIYGGTIVRAYTDADGTEMCGISLTNADDVVYMKQSDVTAI